MSQTGGFAASSWLFRQVARPQDVIDGEKVRTFDRIAHLRNSRKNEKMLG